MNTGKRLLSVILCIAMVLSMMTSFAFAGTDGSVSDSESVPVTDVNTLTGAKPTTDVAAPTIDENVFVIDSTVTAETTGYVLTWEGKEYSTYDVDAVATDMFVYGKNLFADITSAQAVAPVGATYLVKSVSYSSAFGNSGVKQKFTKAGNFYSEAYNTMPFVVGTAFDGSDWTVNQDYLDKAAKLNGVDFAVTDAANSGDFNLYGFVVEYGSYAFDFNNSTVALNVNIQNTYYIPTATDATSWINGSSFASKDGAATSNIQFKNFYLGGSTHRFTSEYLPNNTTLDGFYFPADVDMGGTPYIKQGSNNKASHLVFKNWNIQNEDINIYFQGNNTKNYSNTASDTVIAGAAGNKDFRAITIENCTLNNSAFFTLAGRFIYMYANSTSMYYIKGNRLINTTDTVSNLFVNNSTTWANYLSVDCQNNYFQGYKSCDGFASNNGNSTNGITLKNNYLSDGVSAIGTDLYIKSTNASNDWYSSDWYLDPAMTIKATEVIGDYKTNAAATTKSSFDITLCVPAGETASISSADAVLTAADVDLKALSAGSYTVTATKTVEDVEYAINYTVNVVEFTNPLISEVEDATGLIDGNKVLVVDATANGAAAGSLVEVEWKGKTYSAVAGITVFDQLTKAQAYAKANNIDTPNFLIKSEYYQGVVSGETEWNTFLAVLPGKYFTQNYDKKPYVASDRALDPTGSEWASNVNTGADDSFNTADGIEVKWFAFSNASNIRVGGKYEFYGFTITNCVEDEGAADGASIDVLFQNTYVPKTFENAFFTTSSGKFNNYASANNYTDKVVFKDMYWDGANNGAYKKNLFQAGDTYVWANIEIDGLFADFAGYVDGSNHWINHYYDDHSFVIRNSNLRNAQEKYMFQGDNGKGVNKGKSDATYRPFEKKFILENNIFYNFTLAGAYTGAFSYLKQTFHTTINVNDNFIYTGKDAAVNLFNGIAGDDRQPNAYVTVNNNTLLGINSLYNINRWVSTHAGYVSGANGNYVTSAVVSEEDVLAGNITATGETFRITPKSTQDYKMADANAWLDYERTLKSSDIGANIKAYVPDGGFYVTGTSGAITAKIYLPSTISAADITVNDDMPVWYDTDGNEVDASEITKESVNITDADGNVVGANYVLATYATVGSEDDPKVVSYNINVNVVPNTVEAYPASTYEKIEAGLNDKGNMTYTMEHPTDKEVIEDMPHIAGGFYDDYAMINSVNAALIDGFANYSSYKYTITNGEYKQMEWMGQTYLGKFGESLYQNVDSAYGAEAAVGNVNPEYLLNAGEWGWTTSDGFYGGKGGDYLLRSPGKFFTENYYIDPFYQGDEMGNDWISNIGTEDGMFNPDAYLQAAHVSIDNNAKPGRYELYGFTIGVGVKDARTTNVEAIDLFIKNAYFSCEGNNNYIFYSNESTCDAVKNGSPDSKLLVQNAYIASKGDRSFLRNSAWSEITFDTVYADFAENTKKNTSYFHQVYDETSLVIKNSFFTNTLTDLTYFEGYNNGTNYYKGPFAEGKKSIVLENNVFKDYSFNGTNSFMQVKGGYYSEIILRNNYIDNSGNSMALIKGAEEFLDGVDPEMNVIVEGNTLIGFNGDSGITGKRGYTDESAMINNLVLDAEGAVKFLSAPVEFESNYFLDAEREILSSDLEITEWTTEGVSYEINNQTGNYTVLVEKDGGTPAIADAVAGGDITVYADAELTEEMDDLAAEGPSYVKVSAVNSYDVEAYIVYVVTVLGISDNMFKDVYTAPETDDIKTPIDADKAVIIDYAVKDAAFGTIVTIEWKGTEYDFIKGVTAFATIEEFNNFMAKADLEQPHVLMKTIDTGYVTGDGTYDGDLGKYGAKAIGEFSIKYHANYYTENYNIKPYTVEDGVWAVNPEYNLENGIVARWIKPHYSLAAGTIELYGFAVTAQIQNNGEQTLRATAAVDLYAENIYGDSTTGYAAPRNLVSVVSNYSLNVENEPMGSVTVKNAYVSSANDRSRTLIGAGTYFTNVVFDGIFVDNSNATEFYDRSAEENLDEVKLVLDGDSNITIKNSYASDAKYSVRFVVLGEAQDNVDDKHAVVFDNNVFENVTFAGNDAFIQVDGDYTDVVITNNTIRNDFDVPNVVEVITYNEMEGEEVEDADTVSSIPLNFVIENNILVGFGSQTSTDRELDETSSLAGNYVALNGMGGQQLTIAGANTTLTDDTFKVDEDGSLVASEIYEMTINGADFNEDAQVADVEVRYNRTAIDLYEYLVNVYNIIEVYADEAMTEELDASNIDIDTATVYLKVMSPDRSAVQTRIVNFTIGEAPVPAVEAVSATLYNDITMNFKTVGTEVYENVYAEFVLNGVSTTTSDCTTEGEYVVYHFENIAPHLMSDTITVNIYADVEGTADVIGTYETTFADYLYAIKEEYADTYELYMLAVNALNYGAAAQVYKNHNTDNLANANLEDYEKEIVEDYYEDQFDAEYATVAEPEATWCAKGLYLDEAIDMKLAFKADDITGYTVKVTSESGTQVVDTFVKRAGKYYVYFDGFNVGQVDEVFYFTVMKDGKAVSNTVAYSVQSYAVTAIEQGGEALQNIVNTMMAYGRSAKLYAETYLG